MDGQPTSESSQPLPVIQSIATSDENKTSSNTIPLISSLLMHNKTHLSSIKKGKGQLRNVLLALDADYRDLLVNAKNTEYIELKLQLIENELIKRLKPIFNSTKPEKLTKQKEMIENFFPYIGYLGFNNVLREVFLPMVALDFRYLSVLICYAVKTHILACPTDLKVELNQRLYPWLNITSIQEEKTDLFEVPHVINLMHHSLLDPILESSREQLRLELNEYLTDQLKAGVTSRDFDEIIFVSAENYDVETLQLVVDWLQESKSDVSLQSKVNQYENVLRYRLFKSLQKASSANKTEKLCIHIYAQLNMNFDFLHPYQCLYADKVTNKPQYTEVLLSPLHMLVIHCDQNIYNLFIKKIKNLNPKTKSTGDRFDMPPQDEQNDMLLLDDDDVTPLHLASHLEKLLMIKDLIVRGADIEAVTEDNNSAMLLADNRQYFSVVRILMEAFEAKYPDQSNVEKKALYFARHASQCLKFYESYLEVKKSESASILTQIESLDKTEEIETPLEIFFQYEWNVDANKIDLLKEYLARVMQVLTKRYALYQLIKSPIQ